MGCRAAPGHEFAAWAMRQKAFFTGGPAPYIGTR
jgi:hypothetical protein